MKEDLEYFKFNNAEDNSFQKMIIRGEDFIERKEAGEK